VIWPSTIWSEESHESFDIVVPQTPIPVVTEGHVILVYELHLTNFATEPLSVKRLRIRESDTGRELVSFADTSLAHRISFVSGGQSSHESSTDEAIPPGERAVIFVEFTAKIGAVPRTSSARDRLYGQQSQSCPHRVFANNHRERHGAGSSSASVSRGNLGRSPCSILAARPSTNDLYTLWQSTYFPDVSLSTGWL
jgi:hypothetical protein